MAVARRLENPRAVGEDSSPGLKSWGPGRPRAEGDPYSSSEEILPSSALFSPGPERIEGSPPPTGRASALLTLSI